MTIQNIVKLYDADILPIPHLEIEYVEGLKVGERFVRSLEEYPKPIDIDTAVKLIKSIASGLEHAHSKGIYHRDLKPSNILLKPDFTPKITDWGLAKIGISSKSTSYGLSPLYAAPEQLMLSKYGTTDVRTDIWQLGVIFYELLTGRLPFEGYSYDEVAGKITDEDYTPPLPSSVNSSLKEYDRILRRLLAKRKEERYQTISEFLSNLESIQETEKQERLKKRTLELEKEIGRLKDNLSKTMDALKKSRTSEELKKNRRLAVESLTKLALAYAELDFLGSNKKLELLNTLNDLKFYTTKNTEELLAAINTLDLMISENMKVSIEFINRLRLMLHQILRENM